jgi:hypothetical protein
MCPVLLGSSALLAEARDMLQDAWYVFSVWHVSGNVRVRVWGLELNPSSQGARGADASREKQMLGSDIARVLGVSFRTP